MYISLREHCIAVTQLKVTVCHIFISQLNIYKEKENLSINISIKSQPEFLSASRSSFARATSVPKVSPSRRRRSGSSSMTTGFASPMTILKQIFKRLIFFLISTHTQTVKMKANIAVMSTTQVFFSEVFITAMFSFIFTSLTTVHIYDFHIFTVTHKHTHPKKHQKKKPKTPTTQEKRGKTKRKKFQLFPFTDSQVFGAIYSDMTDQSY